MAAGSLTWDRVSGPGAPSRKGKPAGPLTARCRAPLERPRRFCQLSQCAVPLQDQLVTSGHVLGLWQAHAIPGDTFTAGVRPEQAATSAGGGISLNMGASTSLVDSNWASSPALTNTNTGSACSCPAFRPHAASCGCQARAKETCGQAACASVQHDADGHAIGRESGMVGRNGTR